ncbi:MAG: CPBP family intramembrane metalloprotease [Gemmatimonadetes bacterium]|nr:CPBP family intramembrane metalloprotease [Gemmatimonadota bacterium]
MPSRVAKSVKPSPARSAVQSYWRDARAPRYALTLAAPLLVLYEVLAALTAGTGTGAVRNGADVMIKEAFGAVAGARGPMLFGVLLIGGGAWMIGRDWKAHGAPAPRRLALMFAESVGLALATGVVVGSLTQGLLSRLHLLSAGPGGFGPATQFALSLGAGLYEELLFRVVLVSLLLFATQALLGWSRAVSVTIALVGSALVFSAFHYVGPFGDRFTLASFTFRALAGLWFSGLYVTRGFGITAWAHALYDVALTVVLA